MLSNLAARQLRCPLVLSPSRPSSIQQSAPRRLRPRQSKKGCGHLRSPSSRGLQRRQAPPPPSSVTDTPGRCYNTHSRCVLPLLELLALVAVVVAAVVVAVSVAIPRCSQLGPESSRSPLSWGRRSSFPVGGHPQSTPPQKPLCPGAETTYCVVFASPSLSLSLTSHSWNPSARWP